MTNTEIIAVKLFGWERVGPSKASDGSPSVDYFHKSSCRFAYVLCESGDSYGPPAPNWPDFTDYNWIRKMEDALVERGVFVEYMNTLTESKGISDESSRNCVYNTYKLDTFNVLRATAAQRIEACVKVLDQVEQEKASKAMAKAMAEEARQARRQRIRDKAKELSATMRCNCDLDNWVPEDITGHSHVCRIHKAAIRFKVEEGL